MIDVTDDRVAVPVELRWTLNVFADNTLPELEVDVSATEIEIGQSVTVSISACADVGVIDRKRRERGT